MADTIETRVALAERDIQHLTRYTQDRTNAHSDRLSAIDERVRKQGSKIGQASDALAAHSVQLAKLEPIAARVAEIEIKSRDRRALVRWIVAAAVPLASIALILAGATGRVSQSTVEQVLPHIGKLGK